VASGEFKPGSYVQILGSTTYWRVVGVGFDGKYVLERDAAPAPTYKPVRVTRRGVLAGKMRKATFRTVAK
jgi:hypothetical protein